MERNQETVRTQAFVQRAHITAGPLVVHQRTPEQVLVAARGHQTHVFLLGSTCGVAKQMFCGSFLGSRRGRKCGS